MKYYITINKETKEVNLSISSEDTHYYHVFEQHDNVPKEIREWVTRLGLDAEVFEEIKSKIVKALVTQGVEALRFIRRLENN
jgi:uncharacterized protein YdcH (DUF465 family)